MNQYFKSRLLLLTAGLVLLSCQTEKIKLFHEKKLTSGWCLQSSAEIQAGGDQISESSFDADGWYKTQVPTTVLAALVHNNVYDDIYFGQNLEKIPTDQFQNSWWYRNEFEIRDTRIFANALLAFNGINYSADIWLNGELIASKDTLIGAFRQFEIDITNYIQEGSNSLAVEVFPPEPGDFTVGFVDWNPRPPDRNMGIWREVMLRLNKGVSIKNPHIRTELTSAAHDQASVHVDLELINRMDHHIEGNVVMTVEDIQITEPYRLEPHEHKQIELSPEDHTALNISNPRLWWPINLGEPNLYQMQLFAEVNGEVSDSHNIAFGIREVSDYINEQGHRGYRVNGRETLIRGGGWVDDLLLIEDSARIEAQMKYVKHMNLNTIRLEGFWGNSSYLYDLADEYGILVMPGWSCQWEWEGYLGKECDQFGGIKTPEDMELITVSLRDQVYWLRNHPGIFVWVLASDMLPRPALETMYRTLLNSIDPSRPALASCAADVSEVSGPTGVKMNGPYDYVTPNYWFVDKNRGGAFGFNTETGPGPQPPPLESLKKMIPESELWPINETWEYHCGRNEFNTIDRYVNALDKRYGMPNGVEEFCQWAQVANYEAMRAMFDAFGVNRPVSTGIVQWMLNSAWPEMYWQLYDYYLMPNGAFYATRKASAPVHLVYDYSVNSICIVNESRNSITNFNAHIQVFNLESNQVFDRQIPAVAEANTSLSILALPELEEIGPVYFLDLRLYDNGGDLVSNDFYWLSDKEDVLDFENSKWFVTPNEEYADFSALKKMPEEEKKQIIRTMNFLKNRIFN